MPMPTADQIRAKYQELLKRRLRHTPEEARRGTRTWVKEQLMVDNAPPYALRPLRRVYGVVDGSTDLNPEERDAEMAAFRQDESERRAEALALVSDAHHIAASKYNATAHPSDRVRDGHHLAQKLHGMDLWKQTDAAVAAALGGVS